MHVYVCKLCTWLFFEDGCMDCLSNVCVHIECAIPVLFNQKALNYSTKLNIEEYWLKMILLFHVGFEYTCTCTYTVYVLYMYLYTRAKPFSILLPLAY